MVLGVIKINNLGLSAPNVARTMVENVTLGPVFALDVERLDTLLVIVVKQGQTTSTMMLKRGLQLVCMS